MAKDQTFPPDFLFGAATAAFQIEGGTRTDGRKDSIWDTFCRVPGAIVNADDGEIACDHYHRYREDIALMKDLGLDAYRFSVSWARVRPDGGALNQMGLDYYRRLVDELLAAGIQPWLTLYHWDLPQALQDRGGWPSRDTAARFTEYALDVHDALGDRVSAWTTLNEPWCSSFLSYTAGLHAPGHTSTQEGMLASHHLLLAHGQTIAELRRRDPSLQLGVTLNFTVCDPADPADPMDSEAARRLDGQHNRWFLDPVFRGHYPADILGDFRAADPTGTAMFEAAVKPGDMDLISAPIDILGVNYYHGDLVSGHPQDRVPPSCDAPTARSGCSPFPAGQDIHPVERGLPRTSMNWEVQPDGLTRLLGRIWHDYAQSASTALCVTENGAAFEDELVFEDGQLRVHDYARARFLKHHVEAVLEAIQHGADVRGYFYWSLLDNFEWAWGYTKRFGLIRVDYDSQRRTLKDSANAYRKIIEANRTPTGTAKSLLVKDAIGHCVLP